jgi:SAM-dependent methyltransferase
LELHELGYKDVLGVDPYLSSNIDYSNGVKVVKVYLDDLAATTWDAIMFHHSFEHLPEPVATLKRAAQMMKPGGQCLIRVPLASWAWETYGTNWVQLDPPRHHLLHTERSLAMVAEQSGLALDRVECDSDEYQFWGSELISRRVPISALDNRPWRSSLTGERSESSNVRR